MQLRFQIVINDNLYRTLRYDFRCSF
uniref:Uncharacterized protein n=1 Tax=Anguilla anguilla TaxID=7936 RepID=A0A0E9PWI3_ANGAN